MPWDVSTQALRSLVAVAAVGSFTGAAERLGYTQSAVSKQVNGLETSLGCAVFIRTPRGVTPTAAGSALVARAEVVLEHLDAAAQDVRALSGGGVGRVVLGGFPTTAVDLVPRALARLAQTDPEIDVEFRQASTPVQLRQLRSGRLDLAVVAAGPGLPDYDLDGLGLLQLPSSPLLLAVPTGHWLTTLDPLTPDDLLGQTWVVGAGDHGAPQFGAWPGLPGPVITARAADWSTRLGFVAAGLGISVLPGLAAAAAPRGVSILQVADPRRQRRRLLAAWTGGLTPAVAAVRGALLDTAALLVDTQTGRSAGA